MKSHNRNRIALLLALLAVAGVQLTGCSGGRKVTGSANSAPTAVFSVSTEGFNRPRVNREITFDASESKDSDGRILSFLWSIDDKVVDSSSAVFKKTFTESGPHSILLTLTDDGGDTASAMLKIDVAPNRAPIARLSITTPTYINRPVTFNAGLSSDGDGSIVSYLWNINGQSYDDRVIVKTFDRVGTQQIRLTVTDNEGATSVSTTRIQSTLSGGSADCATYGGRYVWAGQKWPIAAVTLVTMRFDNSLSSRWINAVLRAMAEWHWNSDGAIDFRYYQQTRNLCDDGCNDSNNGITLAAIDGSGGTLAQTFWWYSTSTGVISNADVIVDNAENWSIEGLPSANEVDLQGVMTHEFGHVFALSHPEGANAELETMYAFISRGGMSERSLYCGDKRGLQSVYGFLSRATLDSGEPSIEANNSQMRIPPRPVIIVSADESALNQ